MALRLIIEEGPRKGEEFIVKDDIVIGRSEGDLQLKDSKSSREHAKIVIDSNGVANIEDLDSSNGTLLNGVRIKRALLKAGDVITIGKSKIKIEDYSNQEPTSTQIEKGSWQYDVDKALAVALKNSEGTRPINISSRHFDPVIKLLFIKGVQAGTEYLFSFGPRKAGAACSDALIFEPTCPLFAFELAPDNVGGCELISQSDMVRVNGLEIKRQSLQDGDEISIGQTVMQLMVLKN
jgi:pSer/pThr/pTyr-binding forkhead associated (FHA) protein